jgi:two-component system chemotaxis sensor kinase CheA
MAGRDERLLPELLQMFQAEATEHIQTLNKALLSLERQPEDPKRTELVQEAFRAAHSLKGAARVVSLTPVEQLAHAIEDVLKAARDNGRSLEPATCDTLYTMLDSIQMALKGQPVEVEGLIVKLKGDKTAKRMTVTMEIPAVNGSGNHVSENDETIRVSVGKLDALLAQASELLIARISAEQRMSDAQAIRLQSNGLTRLWRDIRSYAARKSHEDEDAQHFSDMLANFDQHLRTLCREINGMDTAVNRDAIRLGMLSNRLQADMRRIRMIPFQTLEGLFQRTVRDAAHTANKKAELVIVGGEIELDKKVLEALKDPFLHLLRNAVSHGIEAPDVREKNQKPAMGQITITVMQRGNEAHISVADDGQGFDLEHLRQSAEKQRVAGVSDLTPEEIINFAFLPGVTACHEANAISGRGVGLDVVRQQIERLSGQVQVDNYPGMGVTFQLTMPLSLAMTRVLLVRVGREKYALPLSSVEKIITLQTTFNVEGQTMVTVNKRSLPLVSLGGLLGVPESDSSEPFGIVVGSADQRIALLVDDVLTEQELAVKPLGWPIARVNLLSGAAVLGGGEPVAVLNIAELVKSARNTRMQVVASNLKTAEEVAEVENPRLLVVDDSITTRTLEKNILEAAGYEVATAIDGLQAIEQLKSKPARLVIADIEMPNMDGISLTRYLRESPEFSDLPVILVTSLESPADRERGLKVGANAYIVKRGFNQAELLSTIEQFLYSEPALR